MRILIVHHSIAKVTEHPSNTPFELPLTRFNSTRTIEQTYARRIPVHTNYTHTWMQLSNCPAGQPRHRAKDREFRAKHKGRMSQGSVAIGSTERVCWGIKGTVLFRKPRISQSKTQSLVEDHFSVILVWCCTICGFQSSLYNVFRSVKPKLFGCITSLHVL